MQDAVFNLYAIEKCNKLEYHEEYLYHYRKNSKSICNRYSKETIKYAERFILEAEKYIRKYNKGNLYKKALEIRKIKYIDIYMYNYFFHKDNKQKYKIKKNEIIDVIESKMYKEAIKNVEYKDFKMYKKIMLFCLKNKNVIGIYILVRIKQLIKNIQRKNM